MYLYLEYTVKRVGANIVTTNIFKQSITHRLGCFLSSFFSLNSHYEQTHFI